MLIYRELKTNGKYRGASSFLGMSHKKCVRVKVPLSKNTKKVHHEYYELHKIMKILQSGPESVMYGMSVTIIM